MTVRYLSKVGSDSKALHIIVCTGERMEELIHRLYPGIRTTTFEPRHNQDRLSNDFRCYANYEGTAWERK